MHFPLHSNEPPEGDSLANLSFKSGGRLGAMYDHVRSLWDAEGVEYGQVTRIYNSRVAQELGAWAVTMPGGDAIHRAIYRAYFVDGKNISNTDVLLGIVESVGLPTEPAREVLTKRTFKSAVDQDVRKARQYGVNGIPTFVAGNQGVVGGQPYEVLEKLVQGVGAVKR